MKYQEVSPEEYEELFEKIRTLIEKIEHDPRLGYEGFVWKQEIREAARIFVKVKKELLEKKEK